MHFSHSLDHILMRHAADKWKLITIKFNIAVYSSPWFIFFTLYNKIKYKEKHIVKKPQTDWIMKSTVKTEN